MIGGMLEHEVFVVVKWNGAVTVLSEAPEGAEALGEFTDLNEAIDSARARAAESGVEFVDPPEDLVGW